MIRRIIVPASVLLAALLNGCATLSKDQCHTADWSALGERDAYDGFVRDRLASHGKACAEHGVTPDRDAYVAGYTRGLQRFCLPQRGFDYGRGGSSYRNTCPAETDAAFLGGYRLGKALHEAEGTRSSLESRIRDTEKKLKKSDSEEERTKLRAKLRELDDDLIDSNRRLRRLDEDIRQAGFAR